MIKELESKVRGILEGVFKRSAIFPFDSSRTDPETEKYLDELFRQTHCYPDGKLLREKEKPQQQ